MRPLALDYCRPRRVLTLAALGWLIFGVAVLGASAWQCADLFETQALQEERLEFLREKLDRKTKAHERMVSESKQREPELKEAQAVLRRLSVPWDQLFGALEQATSVYRSHIRLAGIQPDVEKGLVLLHGTARDFGELIDYLVRIEATGKLTRVRLVNHQVQVNVPGRPIQFHASAEWNIGS